MKRTIDLVCTYGGIGFAVLFFVGFVRIAHFVPPLSPANSAAQTAAIYRQHTNTIRTGLLVCYVGGTMFFMAFGSAIVGQTRRIVGIPPTITYFQISSYTAAAVLIILPMTSWWTAAFRPDTWSDESIRLMNDFGWITFTMGVPPFVTWCITVGLAILSDVAERPLYPRWAGYLSVLLGFAQITALMLVFFKTGPFAWNGVLSWWIPMTEFFVFLLLITVLTNKAINNRDYENGTAISPSPEVLLSISSGEPIKSHSLGVSSEAVL